MTWLSCTSLKSPASIFMDDSISGKEEGVFPMTKSLMAYICCILTAGSSCQSRWFAIKTTGLSKPGLWISTAKITLCSTFGDGSGMVACRVMGYLAASCLCRHQSDDFAGSKVSKLPPSEYSDTFMRAPCACITFIHSLISPNTRNVTSPVNVSVQRGPY